MTHHINLVKLCVGAEGIEDLSAWQSARVSAGGHARPRHVTRMWPKRADELLAGGSLYWVFKGLILARQRVAALEEATGADNIRRCAIVLDPQIVPVEPTPRRPFQGWRYLPAEDSPSDLNRARLKEQKLPATLAAALAEIGVR